MKKTAIIDLGSNSVRMSIYEEKNGKYTETESYRSLIKLSEGMTRDMRLRPDAQLRAAEALLRFREIIVREGVGKIAAVATAAVRKAENGAEFLEMLRRETGISVEVIDGEREAYYDFLAVKSRTRCESGIICDIGGGSCELIYMQGGSAPRAAVSIPFGSRSLTETFFSHGESREAQKAAEEYVRGQLEAVGWLKECRGLPIVGIGGTIRAAARFDMGGAPADGTPHEMSADRIDGIFDAVKRASFAERAVMTGIGSERADIILGGLLPLVCLKEMTGAPCVIAADIGVRDGILAEMCGGV